MTVFIALACVCECMCVYITRSMCVGMSMHMCTYLHVWCVGVGVCMWSGVYMCGTCYACLAVRRGCVSEVLCSTECMHVCMHARAHVFSKYQGIIFWYALVNVFKIIQTFR